MIPFKNLVKFSFSLLIIGLFSCQSPKQDIIEKEEESTSIEIGVIKSMFSKSLNEEREYLVYTPESYVSKNDSSDQKKYPVLVLLDGGYHFHSATGAIQFMSSNGLIPEMIVVAIPNTDRTRDLSPTFSGTDWEGTPTERFATSGGGEKFLSFLNEELLPEIDKAYNTMDLKVFVGHSLGGLLANHVFLANNTPFSAFISIDPSLWWNNFEYVNLLKENPSPNLSNTKSFFMASAHNSDSKIDSSEMRMSQTQFYNELLLKKADDLSVKFKIYEDDSHNSVPLKALYDGLEFTFKDFKITPEIEDDLTLFKAHFETLSTHWGIDFKPSEGRINDLGYYHLGQENMELAYDYFKLNIELYSNSANAYDSMGEWYYTKGDKKEALANYSKSLELNSDNEFAKKLVKALKLTLEN
jgi:predicted alpha/beta superfamily hydrolase